MELPLRQVKVNRFSGGEKSELGETDGGEQG